MRHFFLLIFLGFMLSSVYYISDISASSEFLVFNTKGSYNLGCELDNSCFEPYLIKISVGDTVTWQNNDDAIHVVVSGDQNSGQTTMFDSGFLKMTESFSFKFNSEGNFGYFCTLHPWMNGYVLVGDVEFSENPKIIDYSTMPVILDSNFKIEFIKDSRFP